MLSHKTINLFKKKKILITGHTGFQGYWITHLLKYFGCKKIYGISLKPKNYQKNLYKELIKQTNPFTESFFCDISNKKKFYEYLDYIMPDFIFHLASQPLVNLSYLNPTETFNTNINGSINLLEWLRFSKKRIVVTFITSDKCYAPSKKFLNESSPLQGIDPYSASKSIQEILVNSYYESFFKKKNLINICTVRSGNIYGGGDFTPGRLIPDLIKSYIENESIKIRNKYGIRPWQYVLDSIWGYLLACQFTINDPRYNSFNFGPNERKKIKVHDVIEIFESTKKLNFKIRYIKNYEYEESKQLNLNSKKAFKLLKWKNKKNITEGLIETINWYQEFYLNKNKIEDISAKLIKNYFSK